MIIMALCVGLFSCSSDDDDEGGSSVNLAGTSWQITSVDDADEAESLVGITIRFNADGTVKSIDSSATSKEESRAWAYGTWTYLNRTLKLILGEDGPDDYMEGQFTFNGNTATYKYHWGDVNGEWTDETYHTMQLSRK